MPAKSQRGRGAQADAVDPPAPQREDHAQSAKDDDASPSDETYFLNYKRIPYSVCARVYSGFMLGIILYALRVAYTIRCISVQIYGYLIHEFDPWFNYRATEYMSTHGWTAFFRWFDYMSWYPLGRPVGSTTYPGLQFTAVAIHRALAALGVNVSLKYVCLMIPAWFSVVASLLVALLSYEIAQSLSITAVSTALFAITPAHMMRSMAGEFDNECIALSAMLLTFYLWVRSLRTAASWPLGALVGVAYGYMVAAWGGYIFVLNMIALHAGVSSMLDWARNTYNPSLLRSYALFYVVGTALALCVPPVGLAPFNSLEQLGALVVLMFLCGQSVTEKQRLRAKVERFSKKGVALLVRIYAACFVGIAVVAVCAPAGFIQPLSIQAYKMFRSVPHTGNPLVDITLAEDASNLVMAWRLLLFPFFGWMIGLSVFLTSVSERYTYAKSFLLLYGAVGLYFSTQTMRMIVMVAPAACMFTGVVFDWVLKFGGAGLFWPEMPPDTPEEEAATKQRTSGDERKNAAQLAEEAEAALKKKKEEWMMKNSRRFLLHMAPFMAIVFLVRLSGFVEDVNEMARQFAAPGLVFHNDPRNGLNTTIIDDYYRGFEWLRDNTPEDARILSWFDYGYQIAGIANRTTLADGNTWNHEHIATIGKMLTSPVAEAHSLVRHMADYVLIFAGDVFFSDLDRSPLLAQMANSVYRDVCPNDPLCRHFGFQKKQKAQAKRRSRHMLASEAQAEEEVNEEWEPTPLMARSLLYHLHSSGIAPGVTLDEQRFQHAYTSANGLVRIFKVMNVSEESKRWVADPANRVCNPPRSWICPGQYPPAKEIQETLARQQSNFQDLVYAYEEAKKDAALNNEYAEGNGDL